MLADKGDYFRLAELLALRTFRREADRQLLLCAAARGVGYEALLGHSVLAVYRGLHARLRETFALVGVEHSALSRIQRQLSRIGSEDEHGLGRYWSYPLRRAYSHLLQGMRYFAEGDGGEHKVKETGEARRLYGSAAERLRRDIEQRAEGIPEPLRLEREHALARILKINRKLPEPLRRVELAQQLKHSLCAALAVVIFKLASEPRKRLNRFFAQGVQPFELRRGAFGHLAEAIGTRLPFFQPARAVYLPKVSIILNVRNFVRLKRAESGFQSAQDAVRIKARVGYLQRGADERHQRLINNGLPPVLEHRHTAFRKGGHHRADIGLVVTHYNGNIAAAVFAGSKHFLYLRRDKGALAADIGRRDHRYAPALALEHVRLGAQEILCESIERGVAVRLIDGDGLCARHVDAVCDFNKLFRGVLRMIKYIVAADIRKVGRVQRDTDIVRLSEYFSDNTELLRGKAAEGVEKHRFVFEIPALRELVLEAGQHTAVVKPAVRNKRVIDRKNQRNVAELVL